MAKIIQFKKAEEKPTMDHELDMARMLMQNMLTTLQEYRYYMTPEDKLFEDLSIVLNVTYAALLRQAGEDHQWHEMMDEILKQVKIENNS